MMAKNSRNYRQGDRVYCSSGVATSLSAQPVGGTGGYTSLYLIEERGIEKELERFLVDDQGRTKKILKPLTISPTLRRESHGNEPRVVEPFGWEESEREEKGVLNMNSNKQTVNIKPFNYVSLFSGIGGFEQALNKLGGTCVLASEIDKFANQAYEVLYGKPTAGDITKIDAKDIPDHDLLVGGFPCQAFSVAGKRLGFDDTRGTLFFEVARIAREKQPKVILLENVKGLIGHDKGKTLDTIVQTLNDIGYTVDFEVLNSKYFGVPQNRERIFIIALRDDLIEQEPWTIEGNTVVPRGKRRISAYEGIKSFNFDWPAQEEVTTRLRDILETDVDEKYYLSDEKTSKLVAQLSEKDDLKQVGYVDKNMQGNRVYDVEGVGATIASQTGGLGGKGVSLFSEPQMLGHIDLKGHDAIKRVYSTESVSTTLTTMGGGHREPKIAEIRPVLTPDRMEKRQQGRRFKEDGEPAFTLNTQDRHGVAVGENPKYRIRKLTSLECWRLQGFSDEAHDAVKAAGISDSQRYKMAGNAVTVNVIEAIAERLLEYIKNEKK